MAAEGGTRAHPDHPSRPLQAHARLADRSGDFGGPLGGTRERDLGRARVRRYRELKNRSWCCRETAPAATLRNSHGAEAFVRVADLAVCTLLTNRIGAPPPDPCPPTCPGCHAIATPALFRTDVAIYHHCAHCARLWSIPKTVAPPPLNS